MARERYVVQLTCQGCGNEATATVEEADNPVYYKNPNRTLIDAAEGFEWVRGGEWVDGPVFRCLNLPSGGSANLGHCWLPAKDASPGISGYSFRATGKKPERKRFRRLSMSDAHDLRPHLETWHGFVKLLGYSVTGIVVLLILMALFLL